MNTTGIPLQKVPPMNHQYYIYNFDVQRFELKSLIEEVREFSVYRTLLLNKTIREAKMLGYEIDEKNSQDGKVIAYIKGKIVGTVESIIVEQAPGQTIVNILSHNKPFSLIVQ